MARPVLTNWDLGKNEIQNARVQNLATAPSSPVSGQIYYDTASNHLFVYNGSTWVAADWSSITFGGAPATTEAIGTSGAAGSATSVSRSDHVHPMGAAGAPAASAVTSTQVTGVATTFAASDHVHAREGFGAPTAQTTFGASSSTGSAATVPHSDHTHGTPTHDNTAHSAINISALAAPTTDVAWGSHKITGLLDPTSAQDAATKAYVDAAVSGLDIKASVRAATTAAGTLASSFANGSVIDGVTLATGDRILIKNQATGSENGIYTVNASGAPTRATDADQAAEVTSGLFTFVEQGTTNAGTGWVLTTANPITLGTTALTFAQFSGGASYTAGNGLTLGGNQFAVGAGTGIAVSAGTTSIDTAVVARKYITTVGDGSSTSIVVTHSLGNQWVNVMVAENSGSFRVIECDIELTSANTVTLRFTTAPASNAYRCIVIG